VILYYITDRTQFAADEAERRRLLLERVAEAAKAGVDYIQLREKDLPVRELERLAGEALAAVRGASEKTKLLINSRTDVALAVGLDGVHLTSRDLAASEARAIEAAAVRAGTARQEFVIGVSCHSVEEVRLAESHGADFAVLAPIFEKVAAGQSGLGVDVLRAAVDAIPADTRVEAGDRRGNMPVLALGGVTVENAAECMGAGAAGVAGIRIFQDGDLAETVKMLREIRVVG
jgi:thiamine-phosphate pyrophosphorylase